MRKVYLALDTISPDPQQFKPWNPVFTAGHVILIEFEVPDDLVVSGTVDIENLHYKNALIVKPEAIVHICKRYATAVRKALEGE